MVSYLPIGVLIPHTANLLEIVEAYGPLADEVQCGLQGCRQRHKKGFLVSFTSQDDKTKQIGMIGHICSRNNFDNHWIAIEQAYEQRKREEQVSDALERFRTRKAEVLPGLEIAIPRLRWQLDTRNILERHGGEAMRACADAIKLNNGKLVFEDGFGIKLSHNLKGSAFWNDYAAYHRAVRLKADIDRLTEYLSIPTATAKGINERLGTVVDIEHRWTQIKEEMAATDEALRPGHLTRVLIIANAIDRATYKAWRFEIKDWELGIRVSNNTLEVIEWNKDHNHQYWVPVVQLNGIAT